VTDDANDRGRADDTPADEPTRDARLRPPDPAGTQPKHDPGSLRPRRKLTVRATSLWAPPADAEHADDDEPDIRPRRADEAAAAADDGDVATPPRYSRYSHRVQFALGALLAIGAAAIVLLVAALIGDNQRSSNTVTLGSSQAWSTWQPPSGGGVAAAEEIAKHVGEEYHLPNGQQLVTVTGGPMEYGSVPVTVAVQQPASRGGAVDLVEGTGVLYRMCDLNGDKDCAIQYGKPTPKRHQLLRREALELALYSFRYLGVTEVVVLLPPSQVQDRKAKGKNAVKKDDPQALLFQREQGDISAALSRPLDRTLSTKTPGVGNVSRWPDARAVHTLTDTKVFNYRLQPGNSEPRAFLVLTPLAVR
jgi:hypothetical protein